MRYLIFNAAKCIGCYNCLFACQDEHLDNDWGHIAKPQGKGQAWLKLDYIERGDASKVKAHWIASVCMHCDEAPCLKAALNQAVYKRKDGLVIIDPIKSKGQKQIVDACPYHAISWNEEEQIPQKCTGCAHLMDRGWKAPRCVTACPSDALSLVAEENLDPLLPDDALLYPDLKATKPRMRHVGLPKKFIAGEVFCPKEDECLEDAEIQLFNEETGEQIITMTDNYGDFWIEGLATGRYRLTVYKQGFHPYEINMIDIKTDVNLGEIPLHHKAD